MGFITLQMRRVKHLIIRKCVGEMCNEEGLLKYPQLFSLYKIVLSISHGNVVPECGFSINKNILSVHGANIKERTIVALRIVKDYLCKVGGSTNLKITSK